MCALVNRLNGGRQGRDALLTQGGWPSALEGAKFLDLMGNEIPAPKTEDGKLCLDDSPAYAVCTR